MPRAPLYQHVDVQVTELSFSSSSISTCSSYVVLYFIQSSSYSIHTNIGSCCMSIGKRFGLMNTEHRELVENTAIGWERPAGYHCHSWDFLLSTVSSGGLRLKHLVIYDANLTHESRVAQCATRPTRKCSNVQN